MNDEKIKDIYEVYKDMLTIHKKYAAIKPNAEARQEIVRAILDANSKHRTLFAYEMFEALRQWFRRKFDGINSNGITGYYTELWRFHKAYLGRKLGSDDWSNLVDETDSLGKKYPTEPCKQMLIAIVGHIENANKLEPDNGVDDGKS